MLGILSKKPKDDIADRVVARLAALGLPGLPRNYEIVYMLETSPLPEMSEAFRSLTKNGGPSQADIDEMHRRFVQPAFEPAHERLLREVKEVVEMLEDDQHTRRKYSEVLFTAAEGITSNISESVLRKLVSMIRSANAAEIDRGKQTVAKIRGKSRGLDEVRLELERFKLMAHQDALTGISNRRVFDVAIRNIYSEPCDRSRTALILTDIDHFKKFNDKFGHAVGDQVLKVVADVLKNNVDARSTVCRMGGEEFAIILHDVSPTQAITVAERLRRSVGDSEIVNKDAGTAYGSVTMSFGVCMASSTENHEELYAMADSALYSSKGDGRNRCTLYVSQGNGAMHYAVP